MCSQYEQEVRQSSHAHGHEIGALAIGRFRRLTEVSYAPDAMSFEHEPISVVCVGVDGWTETESSLLSERSTTAVAFHKPWWRGVRFFHRDGRCYEVESATPLNPLVPFSKLLANTFYNPRLTVRYAYRLKGPYELDELRQALSDAIDKDDDILTQFHDASALKRRLGLAQSFDEVVGVLRFAGNR